LPARRNPEAVADTEDGKLPSPSLSLGNPFYIPQEDFVRLLGTEEVSIAALDAANARCTSSTAIAKPRF
jgi:hypothetical protein